MAAAAENRAATSVALKFHFCIFPEQAAERKPAAVAAAQIAAAQIASRSWRNATRHIAAAAGNSNSSGRSRAWPPLPFPGSRAGTLRMTTIQPIQRKNSAAAAGATSSNPPAVSAAADRSRGGAP